MTKCLLKPTLCISKLTATYLKHTRHHKHTQTCLQMYQIKPDWGSANTHTTWHHVKHPQKYPDSHKWIRANFFTHQRHQESQQVVKGRSLRQGHYNEQWSKSTQEFCFSWMLWQSSSLDDQLEQSKSVQQVNSNMLRLWLAKIAELNLSNGLLCKWFKSNSI